MKKILLLILFSVFLNAEYVKVKLLEDIKISDKKGATKAIILLDEKQKQKSFLFEGRFTTQQMLSGKTNIIIKWSKILKGKATLKIKDKFVSKLSTKENIISNSEFKATGDLKKLTSSLMKIQKDKLSKMPNDQNSKLLEQNGFKNNFKNDDDAVSNKLDDVTKLSDSVADSALPLANDVLAGANNDYNNNKNKNNPFQNQDKFTNAELVIPPVEEATDDKETSCKNDVKKSTIQFKHIVDGKCVNNGSEVPIFSVTDGCTPKIDFNKKIVNVSIKKIADLEGQSVVIENCSIKADKIPLLATYSGCNVVFRKDIASNVQQEQLYYIYNTKKNKIGSCIDSAKKFKITTFKEINKECKPLIDYKSKTVQFGVREVAKVNGKIEEITPCRFEEKKNPILSTYKDAPVIDDFINQKSIQYQRLYYIFENKKVFLGEPQASTLSWKHFLSSTGCTPKKVSDEAVIYEQRIGYKKNNGIIKYISDCKPYSNSRLKIFKEFGDYMHDFAEHQSYIKSREYFKDPDTGNIVYLNDFKKEPVNFQHKDEFVRYENDDTKKLTKKIGKKYFYDSINKKRIYLSGDKRTNEIVIQTIPYIATTQSTKLIKQLGVQQIYKSDSKFYFIYNEKTKYLNHDNGLFPVLKGGSKTLTSVSCNVQMNGATAYWSAPLRISLNISNSEQPSYSNLITSISSLSCDYSLWWVGGLFKKTKKLTYTKKVANFWSYYENIGIYNISQGYLRGDGTSYTASTSNDIYRVIR